MALSALVGCYETAVDVSAAACFLPNMYATLQPTVYPGQQQNL
jgi:hypothetical protein